MAGDQVALKVFAGIGVAATVIILVAGALLLWSTWMDARRRRKAGRLSTLKVQISANTDRLRGEIEAAMREVTNGVLRAPAFDETLSLVRAARAVALTRANDRGPVMQALRVALRPEPFRRIEETASARRRA